VIPGRDQQQGGSAGAGTVAAEQAGGTGGDQRDDEVIEPLKLRAGELGAPAELAQRDADRVVNGITWPGPQRRDPFRQGSRGVAVSDDEVRPGPSQTLRP